MTASSYGARVSEQSGVGRIVVTMVTQSSDERDETTKGGTYIPVSVYGRDEGSESIYIYDEDAMYSLEGRRQATAWRRRERESTVGVGDAKVTR